MEIECENCCSVWETGDSIEGVDANLKSCPLCVIKEKE